MKGDEIALTVRPLTFVPEHGTGGAAVPLRHASLKGLAGKVLEEAAEVAVEVNEWAKAYCAWGQCMNDSEGNAGEPPSVDRSAAEIADTIMACCDLAAYLGIDIQREIDRCEARNRACGRYGEDE